MQPIVTFLREAWKKWERKRSGKHNVPASTFNHVPSPRRSRAWSHPCSSDTSGQVALPTNQISFEEYSKSALRSHKCASIKRRNSSSTVKGRTSSCVRQVTSLGHNHASRESHPAPPLSCFTIPVSTKSPAHSEQDDRASDFSPRLGRDSSRLPSLHLPVMEINSGPDHEFNSPCLKPVRSSLSSHSSPFLAIVENPSTDPRVIVREAARITSRRTRLLSPLVEPSETPDRGHQKKTKGSTSPKLNDDDYLSVPQPNVINCCAQSGDVHDFPLSLFPQPPPLLVRKKVPKPLILRSSMPSSSPHGLVSYSPLLETSTSRSHRPGSLRSISQTSISSSTKRAFGRPLTSVSPPPTSPPNTPLPSPPVDKRTDSNFLTPATSSSVEVCQCASIETSTRQAYRRSAEYRSRNHKAFCQCQ